MLFSQLVNGFWLLTILAKSSILDVWQDSEFASKASNDFAKKALSQIFYRVLNPPLQPSIIFAKLLAICLLTVLIECINGFTKIIW